jgi:GNAT superfamily N-acetyltransferase
LVLKIRIPTADELPRLSDLCFRSKTVWGYDQAFMEACRSELSFDPQDLQLTSIGVADEDGRLSGVVQVKVIESQADLLKLFVEPGVIRRGTGRALFTWAADTSRRMGAHRMTIDADPGAAPFYRRMGARDAGQAPSGSIPGRMLPRLTFNLSSQALRRT